MLSTYLSHGIGVLGSLDIGNLRVLDFLGLGILVLVLGLGAFSFRAFESYCLGLLCFGVFASLYFVPWGFSIVFLRSHALDISGLGASGF